MRRDVDRQLVSESKERTTGDGEDIWAREGGKNRRLENLACWGALCFVLFTKRDGGD